MSHTKKQLQEDLRALGIRPGDTVLMHSSFRSLGGIEGDAAGFFDAFLDLLGPQGTLVLPTLSYRTIYGGNPFFINETPACVGWLPEYFRTSVEGVRRSLHPTHSCAAVGRERDFLVQGHEWDHTPVGANSPFRKMPLIGGKQLMLGCGLAPCTMMHGVEETVMPPYLLTDDATDYPVTGYDGVQRVMSVRRHAFNVTGYAQRYVRLNTVLDAPELLRGKVLDADCFLLDTAAIWREGHRAMLRDPFYFVEKMEK